MRTMLISLILFCSLTQFAIVAYPRAAIAGPPLLVARKTVEGCGKIYQCYVPEICTNKDAAGKPLTDYAVEEVKADTLVTEDCPAIFRYHVYKHFFVHVSVSSFQNKETVGSIEFIQRDVDENLKNIFLCKFEGGQLIGEHNDKEKYTKEEVPSKLECNFNVRTFMSKMIFDNSQSSDQILFKINGTSTKIQEILLLSDKHCDPSNFEFNDEFHNQELHAEVEYIPGKAYCKDEFYEITWNNGSSGEKKYIPVSIFCNVRRRFVINGEELPFDATIDIRCTAEAKYFCDYEVKPKAGEVAPNLIRSNWTAKTGSALKCPDDKPHLIMVGMHREVPIQTSIQCLNYGAIQRWTVYEQEFTKDGPPIYCTNKLKCNLLYKIPASSVRNGRLSFIDFLPECYDKGTMYVGNEKVVDKRCDYTIGKFKYTVNSNNTKVEREIDDSTIFVCKYSYSSEAKITDEQTNKEKAEPKIVVNPNRK